MTGWRQKRGEQEEQQTLSRTTHKEQLECRAQICRGKIPFRNRTFSLGSKICKDMEGYRSEGHSPFLAKQGLCMLRPSQECYLDRLPVSWRAPSFPLTGQLKILCSWPERVTVTPQAPPKPGLHGNPAEAGHLLGAGCAMGLVPALNGSGGGESGPVTVRPCDCHTPWVTQTRQCHGRQLDGCNIPELPHGGRRIPRALSPLASLLEPAGLGKESP